MFGGNTICHRKHITTVWGVVLDQFSPEYIDTRKDHRHFKTLVRVNISDQFFG